MVALGLALHGLAVCVLGPFHLVVGGVEQDVLPGFDALGLCVVGLGHPLGADLVLPVGMVRQGALVGQIIGCLEHLVAGLVVHSLENRAARQVVGHAAVVVGPLVGVCPVGAAPQVVRTEGFLLLLDRGVFVPAADKVPCPLG